MISIGRFGNPWWRYVVQKEMILIGTIRALVIYDLSLVFILGYVDGRISEPTYRKWSLRK